MSDEYIVLQQDFLNWEWYTDPNTKILFLHLLLKCSHKDKNFCGVFLRKGQCITSLNGLSHELGLGKQEVRTALRHLKYSEIIDVKPSKKWTLITILKWSEFQPEKNKNLVIPGIPRSLEEVKEYIKRMNLNVNAFEFVHYYDQREWTDRDGNPVKNWKNLIQKWQK